MGRGTRIVSSRFSSRLRSFHPKLDKLEDRLQPGSILDFFGLSATGVASSVEPDLTLDRGSYDAPVLSVARPASVSSPLLHTPASENAGDTIHRVIARLSDGNSAINNSSADPFANQLSLKLDDGLGEAAHRHPAMFNRALQPRSTLSRGLSEEGFDSAPLKGALTRNNTPGQVATETVTVAAIGAGVASQSTAEDAPLPCARPYAPGTNPFQSMTPYSITYDGSRDTPTTGVVSSPAEYDPMRGVIFSYTSFSSIVTDMVKELTEDPTKDDIAYVVVSSAGQQSSATTSFTNAGANMSKVQFFIQPSDSVWIRDYGPAFINVDDSLAIVDRHYYPNRSVDNFMPTALGDSNFKIPTYDMGLYQSGGNFQPGPNRTGFVTSLVNYHNTATDGYNPSLISELYNKYQGIDTLHVMPQLPFSVDGTGHIDMWMYLVDEDTVVISEFKAGSNATATQITNDAVTYMQNLGFNVYRPQAWNVGSTHYTYANAFRVNDRIFVPVYGTAIKPGGNSSYNDEDADAIAKWTAAAPGLEIIPIQCSAIIPSAGAIHCIVMQVPKHTGALPAANVVSPSGGEILLKGSQHKIEWSAIDTNNVDPTEIKIFVSFNGGGAYRHVTTTTDTGSYLWTVNGRTTTNAVIKVVAKAADNDEVVAISDPFTITAGTATKYDFSEGAGVNKFAFGSQTSGWAAINGNTSPVGSALSAGNYTALSTSNATGGDTDANRYIAPVPSPTSNESTHTFSFNLPESISDMDEIAVRWEGYADYCTHVELYVWDIVAGNWGDATGLSGNNRYMDSWAGNVDGTLDGYIRSDFSRYVDGTGTIRFLVYSDRTGTNPDTQHNTGQGIETFHDYMSVTVKQV